MKFTREDLEQIDDKYLESLSHEQLLRLAKILENTRAGKPIEQLPSLESLKSKLQEKTEIAA